MSDRLGLNKFKKFLHNLGFQDEIALDDKDTFTYTIRTDQNTFDIHYVYTVTDEQVFQTHLEYWNKNNVNVFIAVNDEKTFVINAKAKPDPSLPPKIKIHTFNYGVNTDGFEKEKIREISKDYIDASYFFDFIIKNQKSKQEVDKDLLLNLIALKNDLLKGENEDIIHLLILRCLFLKYLEDNNIYDNDYLVNILQTQDPQKLIHAFDKITKINGDIFKFDRFTENEIEPIYLKKLYLFFSSDFRTKQLPLFPYKFNHIPIQLISHVYEAFLKSEVKKGKGVYYTPSIVVDLMLSHTLTEKLKQKLYATILDPAVGSGAFLVESFRMIIKSYNGKIDYVKKKEILQNQLFGIDIDSRALQIATFSLYLALIETENSDFIRKQIENSHPILPSLIGKNLIKANALTDNVFEDRTFDCIISNPPWGSVKNLDDPENQKERKAIETKGKIGTISEYKNVSDYERSQAFLLRAKRWSNEDTIFSMIVKNSIFLNDKADDFRQDLLNAYQVTYFYELSNYNKILFKKRIIGKINGKNIEIGATEPCAILVFNNSVENGNILKYISPKSNDFSENFEVIHFTQKDINEIEQNRFLTDDLLWRVLVNGSFEDYKLIHKIINQKKELKIVCSKGFEPQETKNSKEPIYRTLIKSKDFDSYRVKNKLSQFNWNQKLRRTGNEDLYIGDRILIANRPKPKDNYRLRCILANEDLIFRNDLFGFKIEKTQIYHAILALLNSSLIGYFLFNTTPQWIGGIKREALRVSDIKSIPFPNFDGNAFKNMSIKLRKITKELEHKFDKREEIIIDELIFKIYGLLDYEKEIIREFYQIKVERSGEKKYVNNSDLRDYIKSFICTFELMLSDNYFLTATYKISSNVGAVVCFTIVDNKEIANPRDDSSLEILHFVKKQQLKQADVSKILNEDKVIIYDDEFFYIIKSNLFKDWTKRQAIKDAKEEIGLMLSKLPETHGA